MNKALFLVLLLSTVLLNGCLNKKISKGGVQPEEQDEKTSNSFMANMMLQDKLGEDAHLIILSADQFGFNKDKKDMGDVAEREMELQESSIDSPLAESSSGPIYYDLSPERKPASEDGGAGSSGGGFAYSVDESVPSLKNNKDIYSKSMNDVQEEVYKHSRQTGIAFLKKNEEEDEDYDIYSYLLLTETAEEEKNIFTIMEYLRTPTAEGLEIEGVSKSNINIFYMLMKSGTDDALLEKIYTKATHENLTGEPLRKIAVKLLRFYSFERAEKMLGIMGVKAKEGPYILSFENKFNWSQKKSAERHLFQDMSIATADLIAPWISAFKSHVKKHKFWEEDSLKQFIFNIRAGINIVAIGFSEVVKASAKLEDWIKVVRTVVAG